MCWHRGEAGQCGATPPLCPGEEQSTRHPVPPAPAATRGQRQKDDTGKGAACPEQGKGPAPPGGSIPIIVTSVTGTSHRHQSRAARGEPGMDTRGHVCPMAGKGLEGHRCPPKGPTPGCPSTPTPGAGATTGEA